MIILPFETIELARERSHIIAEYNGCSGSTLYWYACEVVNDIPCCIINYDTDGLSQSEIESLIDIPETPQ